MFFPKRFKDERYYQSKLKEIDDSIEKAIMKPVLSSGHAFILFDTIDTMQRCLRFFSYLLSYIHDLNCVLE